MSDRHPGWYSWQRAREITLAVFTLWLIVQNLVLLAFVPWGRLGSALVVANAVLKAAFLVMAPLWILLGIAITGATAAAFVVKAGRPAPDARHCEVRHG